jgi:mono/diheme cytochrome c family protein
VRLAERTGLFCAVRAGVVAALFVAGHAAAQSLPAISAPTTPTTAPTAETAEAGRKVYTSFCTRCHGVNLVTNGGLGADLRQFPADGRERFNRGVLKGLRAMPAWEGTIKPEQVDQLWAYITAVNGW